MIVWHYTKGIHYPKIMESGFIMPSTQGIPCSEMPVVWFSARQDWEPTGAPASIRGVDSETDELLKSGRLTPKAMTELVKRGKTRPVPYTVDQTHDECNGACRFGMDPEDLLHWSRLKVAAHISKERAADLARVATLENSDVALFYGTMEPVPVTACCAIQRWDKGSQAWVDV